MAETVCIPIQEYEHLKKKEAGAGRMLETIQFQDALLSLAPLKGASKKKTTDAELEKNRQRVFDEFDKKFK